MLKHKFRKKSLIKELKKYKSIPKIPIFAKYLFSMKNILYLFLVFFVIEALYSQPLEIQSIQFQLGKEKVKEKMGSYHFQDKTLSTFFHHNKIILNKPYQHQGEFYQIEATEKPYGYQFQITNTKFNRIQLKIKFLKNEIFVGGGEQFSHVILNGHKIPIWVEEQGIGRGDLPVSKLTKKLGISGNEYTTYAPVPFVFSNKNRGIFCTSKNYQILDFQNEKEWTWEIWDTSATFHIFYGNHPKEILQNFTQINGRLQKLPDWAYGSWIGLQGGKTKCNQIIEELQKYEHPISALWIQDWVGKRKTFFGSRLFWNWLPNEKYYPEFKKYCDSLNQNFGIKVLGYINPFLATHGSLAKEALKNDYLVKNLKNQPYKIKAGGFKAYLIDLSNPQTCQWIKNIIKTQMIQNGLSGWMTDFGEWLPYDCKIYKGLSKDFHNQYVVEWVKLNREAIQELGLDTSHLFFNRSAYSYSAGYMNSLWAGDQMTSFQKHDGMPSALTGILTSGLSGFSINHSDIGGYTNLNLWFTQKYLRTSNIMQKWTEMSTFFPIFRTHEGLIPEKNYQFYSQDSAMAHFTLWAKIHYHLKFYFEKYVQEATETGLPVIRHLLLEYPELESSWKTHHGFLVGKDLLIYPNFGQEKIEVFLPKENWYCVNNKQYYSDGYYQFQIPNVLIFIRKNSEEFQKLKEVLRF